MNLHVTRGWGPSSIETDCPCPVEPCGYVDMNKASEKCPHHHVDRYKTMRSIHSPEQCPRRS